MPVVYEYRIEQGVRLMTEAVRLKWRSDVGGLHKGQKTLRGTNIA